MSAFSDLISSTINPQVYMRFEGESEPGLFPGSLRSLRLNGVGFDIGISAIDIGQYPNDFFFLAVLNWDGGNFTLFEIPQVYKITVTDDGINGGTLKLYNWINQSSLGLIDYGDGPAYGYWDHPVSLAGGVLSNDLLPYNVVSTIAFYIETYNNGGLAHIDYSYWSDCDIDTGGDNSMEGVDPLWYTDDTGVWPFAFDPPTIPYVFSGYNGWVDELVVAYGMGGGIGVGRIPPMADAFEALPFCAVMDDPEFVPVVLPAVAENCVLVVPVFVDEGIGVIETFAPCSGTGVTPVGVVGGGSNGGCG